MLLLNAMNANIENGGKHLNSFPFSVIITRWVFALTEMGIASYFVFKFGFQTGLLFLVYGIVCVFVLLPLIRCARCFYYGKRCNFGLGKWASLFFPEAEEKSFMPVYGYAMVFWPLRLMPIGLGIIPFLGVLRNAFYISSDGSVDFFSAFISGFGYFPHAVFIIYLLVIFLHRIYYRSRACSRCRQKPDCPVYDINILRGTFKKPDSFIKT